MGKVLYLLGAGASYGKIEQGKVLSRNGIQYTSKYYIKEGIPIVNEINQELEILIEELKGSKF